MLTRDDVVNAALSVVGLSAKDDPVGTKQKYIDLVGPDENKSMQSAMCTMSGCGLTVAGIWRLAGFVHPKLAAPYKIGTAIARLLEIAKQKFAWKPYTKDLVPQPGDMVMVGDSTPTGGIEHVYTVTNVTKNDKGELIIESVDGGQRTPDRFQLISAKQRVWRNRRDLPFMGTDPGSNLQGGRIVVGIIDIDLLFK